MQEFIVPIAVILLGGFSLGVRYLAEFSLEDIGSDLVAMSTSLQLNLFFSRTATQKIWDIYVIHLDVILLLLFFITWVFTLAILKKGKITQNRKWILLAFLIGSMSLGIELTWRGVNV